MATAVGQETDINSLVEDLIILERDAISAYDSTIERLGDAALGSQVAQFRKDHIQHLDVLNEMAAELGIAAPQKGDAKELLTTGKIALAQLLGDRTILKAMKTNEDDTVTAYERATSHPDAVDKSRAFFAKALADEKRHREWMEKAAASL